MTAAQPERRPEEPKKPEEKIVIVEELPPRKSRVAAGLLSIFLGWIGVGRFYMGFVGLGVLQIIVSILTAGIGGVVWGVIDGVLILTHSINYDAYGHPLAD